jgi:hypothetical protein
MQIIFFRPAFKPSICVEKTYVKKMSTEKIRTKKFKSNIHVHFYFLVKNITQNHQCVETTNFRSTLQATSAPDTHDTKGMQQ